MEIPGKIGLRIRRDDEQTTAPEPHTGIQGEGGAGRHQGEMTLAQLSKHVDVRPNQITTWKAQLQAGAADLFGPGGGNGAGQPAIDVKSLHAKIEELTLETIWKERSASRPSERKAMIGRAHDRPITKQARH